MLLRTRKNIEHQSHGNMTYKLLATLISFVLIATFGVLPASADQKKPRASFDMVDMVILENEMVIGDAFGASGLHRDRNGADATIHLADLTPGMAYSVWALAFNRPNKCHGVPCLPGPDGAEAKLSIFWVAGGFAAQGTGGGVLNLSFRMERGQPLSTVIPAFLPNGLTNVRGAEIHFIVVEHGEASPGFTAMPMTTPGPGMRAVVHPAPSPDST